MGPAEEDLRTELRAWIADHDPGPPPAEYGERIEALTRWQAALCEAGFMGLSWPVQYGGRGMSLAGEAVLAEELARSGAAELINRLALYTWGPTLMDLGEPSQLERFLPGMLDASELWCQGFSEPDAGSDLAGVRTRAEVDGDELVVTGQKVWTSRAELSTWNALLVRTDGEPGQHGGLTLLMTNMKSDGITIRPLPQMLGEPHFSEVFFDEVRVPVANVLGGINEGWRVSMKAMGYERGIFVLERSIRLRRRLSELAGRVRASGGADRAALAGIGRIHASLEMLTAQAYRTLAHQQAGTLLPADDPWWRTHYPPNGWGCKCRVRQVSRREAERLGGVTARPASPTREWTNRRTGETMRVPRGIDPGWDVNAGLERQQLLMEGLNGKLDAADQELARAAVGTVTGSPLLDRQLAPMKPGDPPKGDLPVGFLEREWRDMFGVETQLVRLTQRTARKQRLKHPDLILDDYREMLPSVLRDAQIVLSESGHYGRRTEDLVFFYFVEGEIYKAAVAMESERRVRMATFHETDQENVNLAVKRGKIVRNRRER